MDELERRKNLAHCSFCEHAYIRLFKYRCRVKNCMLSCLNAKNCPNYKPTLEPIERRSLS